MNLLQIARKLLQIENTYAYLKAGRKVEVVSFELVIANNGRFNNSVYSDASGFLMLSGDFYRIDNIPVRVIRLQE